MIGRKARDYVWVMARTPELSDSEYEEIVQFVGSIGYDTSEMNRVPQQWPEKPSDSRAEGEAL